MSKNVYEMVTERIIAVERCTIFGGSFNLYEKTEKGLDSAALAGLQLPTLYSESDPFSNNSIPNSSQTVNNPEMKVSQTRTNTMPKSGIVTESEMDTHFPEENFTYETVSEKLNDALFLAGHSTIPP